MIRGRAIAVSLLVAGTVLSALAAANSPSLARAGAATQPAQGRSIPGWLGSWPWRYQYLGGLALLASGCLVNAYVRRARVSDRPAQMTERGVPADLAAPLRLALERTVALQGLDSAVGLKEQLDAIVRDGCQAFAAQQHVLQARLRAAGYVEVMSLFAQGERRLNRAWSACVDGYLDEAVACVHEAAPFLQDALASLEGRLQS